MVLFVAAHVLSALAPSYGTLMAGRITASLAHGAYMGVGSVVAASLVRPERRASAIAMMFVGLSLANVVGVPFGTFLGQALGWRATFWVVGAIGLVALAGLAVLIPRQPGDAVRWFHGRAARSLIHERDIADVAVLTLTEPGRHDGAAYELTGPEVITQVDQVHAIGEAIGRPLHFEELPRQAAIAMLAGTGLPEPMAAGIVDAHATMADNPETTTNTVERLTGHPARTYSQWAREHAELFA